MSFNLMKFITGPIETILERVVPDKNAREKMAHEIAMVAEQHANDQMMAQIEVNKEEAKHPSVFVAGWRPAVAWVIVFGLGWNYVLMPIMMWVAFLCKIDLSGAPSLDISELISLLFGMLGFGGWRTFEKIKGVARENLKE